MTSAPTSKPKPAWWNPGWSMGVWAMVAFLLIPTLGFAFWVLIEAGGQTEADPALKAIAEANAGGPVTVITGTAHTIYHAAGPLPGEGTPRSDGRLTLVWFTSATCGACEDQLFVHRVMQDYRDQAVFVEKELGREPAAARLGVTGAPAFVWLDASGKVIGQVAAGQDEAAFRASVAAQLAAGR